jgi:hypothetical protein
LFDIREAIKKLESEEAALRDHLIRNLGDRVEQRISRPGQNFRSPEDRSAGPACCGRPRDGGEVHNVAAGSSCDVDASRAAEA